MTLPAEDFPVDHSQAPLAEEASKGVVEAADQSCPPVFEMDGLPQSIEGLPGVYVTYPPKKNAFDMGMDFSSVVPGELFTLHDTNPPPAAPGAKAPEPTAWARCQSCLRVIPLNACVQSTGPEVVCGEEKDGRVLVGRLTANFCNDACREAYDPVLWSSTRKPEENAVDREFHRRLYHAPKTLRWLGVPLVKNPLDLLVYQEILHEVSPDLVVETGTLMGGSALYLASLCELLGKGHVVTIDVDRRADRPKHPRITYVHGSSTDPRVVAAVSRMAQGKRTLVVLDSDHSRDHVLAEMRAYASSIDVGSYLVVEDTDVNGHPVLPDHGPGPAEAVAEFLASRDDFVVDYSREKFLASFHPGGFLRRVRREGEGGP